ncbi:MAG: hypothetical protein CMJ49_09325 [Planctomycetaceae bacterium]|nr:hypothetical protein [Planctomycetaceae bacterium]
MTETLHDDWAVTLVDLLDQQRAIYHQLEQLATQQGQLVDAGEAESLLTILAERQALIDQLSQINGKLAPFRQQWPTLWEELDADQRAQVTQRIDQVQQLLDQIVAHDQRDRATLQHHRDRLAGELDQVKQGAAMNRAYQHVDVDQSSPRFTDNEG